MARDLIGFLVLLACGLLVALYLLTEIAVMAIERVSHV